MAQSAIDHFCTENALVDAFVSALYDGHETSLPAAAIVREFSFLRGKPDVVSVSAEGEVIAFEAKLTRWRDALVQAYRNTCFAHRSFVVLPWKTAHTASKFCAEFERRSVGICAVKDGRLIIIQAAVRVEPVEPWLSVEASEAAARAEHRRRGVGGCHDRLHA